MQSQKPSATVLAGIKEKNLSLAKTPRRQERQEKRLLSANSNACFLGVLGALARA
jgi:hypothetical protein